MKPIDPSDSHLEDRAIEFRVLKSLVVVFLVTLASVFFRWEFVFGAFAVGYVAYRARYYGRRVGVYSTDDLGIWADRLEYGLLGFVAVTVGVAVAVEAVFPPDWNLGGFLSLPPVDFTDIQGLLQEPLIPVGWAVVVAPVVGASYVALQFRKRLLVGLDSRRGAVRATIWDSLVYLPVSLLWIAVLTMGPVYDVWEPVVDAVSTELELTPGTTGGFAVIFGERFAPVVSGGIGVPAAVVGAYLGVQRRKYEDATMPEILGYRGFMPPSRDFHQLNAVAPAGTYALYAVAIFVTLGTLPVAEPALLLGVAVAAVVGANVLGKTTTTLQSLSEELGESVDAVVVGFALGLVLVAVALPVVGAEAQPGEVLVAYPVLGVPLTYAGNWLAGRQAVSSTSEYADSVEADWNAFDESMTDRLFVYSDTRDNTLRAAAIDGLASSVRANTYRKGEALDVFRRALASDDEEIVRAGLRGIAGVLAYDRSKETYERLAHAGAPGWITWYLDSSSERTRILAAEAGARIFAVALDVGESTPAEQLDEDDVEGIGDVVEHNPNEPALVAAVVEYFSRLWFVAARQDGGIGPNHPDVQRVLGTLIWLSEYADENTRLTAAFAVTGERAVADEERLTLALDRLDSESRETRYMAAHVVRSSMDRHADRIDPDAIAALLEDSSDAVRWMGAEALVALLRFAPERGGELRDRFVFHLEENQETPGRTESAVIRALSAVETERLVSHPTASSTVASYVDEHRQVAPAAARLLSSLVQSSRSIARQDDVRDAIEAGLTHDSSDVRTACLEAAATLIDDSVANGRQLVGGLAANLDVAGRQGVLAAVSLAQVVDEYPRDGLDIVPELASGLLNRTSVGEYSPPFIVRGSTVSAVVVDIVADAVALDSGRGEALIEPLVDIATTADQGTLVGVFSVLADLSEEFPDESRGAVEVAAVGLEAGRVAIRRDAAKVLANVGAYHPEAVEPYVDRLLVATDDDSPRVRSSALIALQNVCTAIPTAVESDIHRIVGLLDDDSATVRTHAAELVLTVSEREPGLIEPAAETADRLRRLQRDPAVDLDAGNLQDASTAIQTGVPTDEVDAETDREEVWSPESSDEMGVSGDTNVFEPVGDDFDPDFDEEFPDEVDEEPGDWGKPDGDTTGGTAGDADGAPPGTDETATGEPGADTAEGFDEEPDTPDQSHDVSDQDTVIQDDESASAASDVGDESTVIRSDEESGGTDDVGDESTVIEGGQDDREPDTEGETGHASVGSSEAEDGSTGDDAADSDAGDVGDHATVIESDDANRESGTDGTDEADDVGSRSTVVEPDDDVADMSTVIEPEGSPDGTDETGGPGETDDVEDLDTVVEPDADEGANAEDGDDGSS